MSDILQFRKPEPIAPHLAGEARCLGCRHVWAAVAPIGVWQLDCPKCGSAKGIFTNPVGADAGQSSFHCACGCEALTAILDKGKFWLRCMSCGLDQTEAVFG